MAGVFHCEGRPVGKSDQIILYAVEICSFHPDLFLDLVHNQISNFESLGQSHPHLGTMIHVGLRGSLRVRVRVVMRLLFLGRSHEMLVGFLIGSLLMSQV